METTQHVSSHFIQEFLIDISYRPLYFLSQKQITHIIKFNTKIYKNKTLNQSLPVQYYILANNTYLKSSQWGGGATAVAAKALWQCNCPYGWDVVHLINSGLKHVSSTNSF